MVILKNNQLYLVRQAIERMFQLLESYDLLKSAKFRPILQMMLNNIKQCINSNFDGIEILSKYLYEDWKNVCVGENGLEYWYLKVEDLILKEEINKEFEKVAISIEKVLDTNFILPKKWYSYDELVNLGKEFKRREEEWKRVIEQLVSSNRYYQSPKREIPNDIWSYAKMLCIEGNDELLEEWFLHDVPEFGYLSPERILKISNGDDILRFFMYNMPI